MWTASRDGQGPAWPSAVRRQEADETGDSVQPAFHGEAASAGSVFIKRQLLCHVNMAITGKPKGERRVRETEARYEWTDQSAQERKAGRVGRIVSDVCNGEA